MVPLPLGLLIQVRPITWLDLISRTFGKGHEKDGMYIFDDYPTLATTSVLPAIGTNTFTPKNLDLWQARLGHVHFQNLCLLFYTLQNACKTSKF
ncbi:hypothetical protein GIB67_040428 [Kingdonia uniflora]|uniref:GAG-pre-integrase domain-containing protein n=1 Tax=Kingdonia uniflora TaxID=39325 RepID=A0A7J7KXQ6_9MAGN|nr:hypothetical protein GIB67_040428 [Kingdonia uniflora]